VKVDASQQLVYLDDRGRLLHVWDYWAGMRTLNRDTGKLLPCWKATDEQRAASAILSGDGRRLLTWVDEGDRSAGACVLWDAVTGKRLKTLTTNFSDLPVTHLLALSRDGRLAAETGWLSGWRIRWWDTSTRKERPPLRLPEEGQGAFSTLLFSPDGHLLAGGTSEGHVSLWDTNRGREVRRLMGHTGAVPALAFSLDGKTIATGGNDHSVRLWEVATCKERARFTGHTGAVVSLCFAQGSRLLVSGSADTTALLWNVLGDTPPPRNFARLWEDLGSSDARRAFLAISAWSRSGALGVRHLEARLRPVPPVDVKHLARLLADLDGDTFAERERASRALAELGERIGPDLERALKKRPSAEMRRRLLRLLDQMQDRPFAGEELRAWRALEILEQMVSPEAERLLARLADRGAVAARFTREARIVLGRLQGPLFQRYGRVR
jgi:hypothetical protein